MLTVLNGGVIANLTAGSSPRGDEAMFREVARQLRPHHRVTLDPRRFVGVEIEGPGWMYTSGHMQHFAVRLTAGCGTFVWSFSTNGQVALGVGAWVYVPFQTAFRMKSGRGQGEYPCQFVIAQMVAG